MLGKFKCFVHGLEIDSKKEWDKHCAEEPHLYTGIDYKVKRKFRFFGTVPLGKQVIELLSEFNYQESV